MTASGSQNSDASNDSDVETSLEHGTDLCITIGVEHYQLSTVSGSVTTSNYDVIYLQGQNNWSSTYLNQFDSSDLAVIDSFLTAGGGLVVGEWHAWNACARSFSGAWGGLDALMPVTIRSGCDYGSNQKVRFCRWERPNSPLIDTGVSSDFIFEPADFAGSLSFLELKPGATPYYWATWDPDENNIPPAVSPSQFPLTGGVGDVGMAGWVPVGKTGRVFSFATTNGAPELADTGADNNFRRLLINALGWSGSIGGSINPDAIAVNVQGNSTVLTPALSPARIVGPITYSIVNGTLPPGLTLNSSTGSISGTPTQNETVTVTIQATGSQGQAEAFISFTISGLATVTPTTVTDTTTSQNLNSSATDNSSTVNKQVQRMDKLPSTGSGTPTTILTLITAITIGTLLLTLRRRLLHK